MTKPTVAKQFCIEIVIPLSAGPFAHAKTMTATGPLLGEFKQALQALFPGATIETGLMTPREKKAATPATTK
jgi:hypothetical protein